MIYLFFLIQENLEIELQIEVNLGPLHEERTYRKLATSKNKVEKLF